MTEYKINLFSCHLNGPTQVTVLAPSPSIGSDPSSFYANKKKYKVLWLLHAGCGSSSDWTHYSVLPRLLNSKDVIAVIPDGLNSDFSNHPEFGDGYAFADFFFQELIPFIQNWMPASPKAEDNFLVGASMGSMGAWTLLMQHPERFGGIAPLSGIPRDYAYLEQYRTMSAGEFRAMASADRKQFPAGYGNPSMGIWPKEINMICKYSCVGDFLDSIENNWELFCSMAKEGKLPKMFIVGGTEDRNVQKIRAFTDSVALDNVKYSCVEGRGGHGFDFWDGFLPEMLEFFEI